jgi:hypothetical protein
VSVESLGDGLGGGELLGDGLGLGLGDADADGDGCADAFGWQLGDGDGPGLAAGGQLCDVDGFGAPAPDPDRPRDGDVPGTAPLWPPGCAGCPLCWFTFVLLGDTAVEMSIAT